MDARVSGGLEDLEQKVPAVVPELRTGAEEFGKRQRHRRADPGSGNRLCKWALQRSPQLPPPLSGAETGGSRPDTAAMRLLGEIAAIPPQRSSSRSSGRLARMRSRPTQATLSSGTSVPCQNSTHFIGYRNESRAQWTSCKQLESLAMRTHIMVPVKHSGS